MEITFDTLINILSLLLGGGGGAFFVWRYQRKKAKAEAAEAEISAAQKMQDMYQQMIEDKQQEVQDKNRIIAELRDDRDHYKQKYKEVTERQEQLTRSVAEWKSDSDKRIRELQAQVARNGRQMEAIRSLICADMQCKLRKNISIGEAVEMKKVSTSSAADEAGKAGEQTPHDIEPIESEAL